MKKKLFAIMCALFVMHMAVWAQEATGYCGDPNVNEGKDVTWKLEVNGTTEGGWQTFTLTISGTGAMTDESDEFTKPWSDGDIELSDGTFVGETFNIITKVVIEEGVTSIGNYAFSLSEMLSSIEMPSTLKRIGDYAFWSGFAVTYGYGEPFSLVIPEGVESIGECAFESCRGFESVILPKSLKSIGENAFAECDIPKVISYSELPLEKGTSDYGCVAKTADILLISPVLVGGCYFTKEDGAVMLSHYEGNDSILVLPDYNGNDYDIGELAFARADIKSVTIPEGVVEIQADAFRGSTLASVILPASLTTIGTKAFYGCSNLRMVTCNASVPPSLAAGPLYGETVFRNIPLDAVLIVKDVEAYKKSDWMEFFGSIVSDPNDVVETKTSGFCGNPDVNEGKDVAWNYADGTLTVSGNGAMADYSTAVEGPGRELPWCTFREQIKKVVIEDGVTHIGSAAFSSDANGYDAYYNISALEIAESVVSIGQWAFRCCKNLGNVQLPSSLKSIADRAFALCVNLSTDIPSSVTEIGNLAFYGCSGLTSVVIPEGVTEVANSAFGRCVNLASVSLPSSLTAIEEWGFEGCESLKSIIIPNNVKTIGANAFSGCKKLSTVVSLSATPPVLGEEVFDFDPVYGVLEVPDSESIASYKESDWANFFATLCLVGEGDAARPATSGFCGNPNVNEGKDVCWEYSGGTVIILGVGAMSDFNMSDNVSPWHQIRDYISTVAILGGVEIGDNAFYGCKELSTLVIDSASHIGDNAFAYCENLVKVECFLSTPPALGENVFEGIHPDAVLVLRDDVDTDVYASSDWAQYFYDSSGYCGDPNVNEGKDVTWKLEVDEWSGYTTIVISGTGEMANFENPEDRPWNLFANTIECVRIEDGVTSVGDLAFGNCKGLIGVDRGFDIKQIGDFAFAECDNLTGDYYFIERAEYIGEGAFSGCRSLRGYNSYDNNPYSESMLFLGASYIGPSAFQACWNLDYVDLEGEDLSVCECAFMECKGLTTLRIGGPVKSIGDRAFAYCENLDTVKCGAATPPTLGENVFEGIHPEAELVFDSYMAGDKDMILAYAASDWDKYFKLPPLASGFCGDPNVNNGEDVKWELSVDSVLTISGVGAMENYKEYGTDWTFYDENIATVVVEEGVTTIGANCFRIGEIVVNCGFANLKSVTLPSTLVQIGESAFSHCMALESVAIPEGLLSIGERAFYNCEVLESITIPNSVTSIGVWAFWGCNSLSSVTCLNPIPPTLGGKSFYSENAVLRVPDVEAYKASDWAQYFSSIEQIDLTAISGVKADMNMSSTTIHDLSGRRVTAPVKGRIYIVNGKATVW